MLTEYLHNVIQFIKYTIKLNMKKIAKLLLSLIAISILITSCEKEDNIDSDSEFLNYLKVGDKKYELSLGALKNNGEMDGLYEGFNTPIWLVSEGVTITDNGNSEDKNNFGSIDIKGKGHFIYFELFSTKGDQLDNITYKVDPGGYPHDLKTFSIGEYFINEDFDSFYREDSQSNDLFDGGVTVNKEGDEYEISINFEDEEGVKVTGYYKGKLKYFEAIPNNNNNGYFKVEDTEYKLTLGAMQSYQVGAFPKSIFTPIWLHSKGINSYKDELMGSAMFKGKGDGISFYLNSQNDKLDNGEYTFNDSGEERIGTFYFSAYSIDKEIEKDVNKVSKSHQITGGKITVNKWGVIYSIDIDCTDNNGKKVTGYYNGPLLFYNNTYDW